MNRLAIRHFAAQPGLVSWTRANRNVRLNWLHRQPASRAWAHSQAVEVSSLLPSKPADRTTASPNGQQLTVDLGDSLYTLHAQWLYDARCDLGHSKPAEYAFCHSGKTSLIQDALVSGENGSLKTQQLNVTWQDGTTCAFPMSWVRVMAPVVGKALDGQNLSFGEETSLGQGWRATDLKIPSVAYEDLIAVEDDVSGRAAREKLAIMDEILQDSGVGLVRVEGLPAANMQDERNKENTLVTKALKGLFGKVFEHPVRGKDKTFNVASHHQDDTKRGVGLPNYDTNQVLLPHGDHAHYNHPIRVQGWYGLEGESENTFVSALAALQTMENEAPELVGLLGRVPITTGRVAHYYQPPMYQGTVDTPVTYRAIGARPKVHKVRWHPHLTSSLLASFDEFDKARLAHQKFQQILRRDTHQIKVVLKPGDMYIWDNYRVLHGRERVLRTPRTGVGQTVPDQVVFDRYRSLNISQLKHSINEDWLVSLPHEQLYQIRQIFEEQ